jgi:hypothetical protein
MLDETSCTVRCRSVIGQRWSPFCAIVVCQKVTVKLFEGLKGRAVRLRVQAKARQGRCRRGEG